MQVRIATYNIENMRRLFKNNRFVKDTEEAGHAAAATLGKLNPHIAGIVEATDRIADHEFFLRCPSLDTLNFKTAKSPHRRGKQDLVFYYRYPFELVSLDDHYSYYDTWIEDIDDDSIKEQLSFERKPLEAVFEDTRNGRQIRIILVSLKSKAVFHTTDIHQYEYLALANRKKLYGQAKKVRERVDDLLKASPDLPLIVMGDMNDEPGLDHFEKILGASAVETLTGSIYHPMRILHNTLWHYMENDNRKELWTTEYPDRVISNFALHRAWIDHIFVSPGMLKGEAHFRYVPDSGAIAEKDSAAKLASDHFPVYCDIALSS